MSLALAVTAAGCADDPCKESAPAVQVRLALGSAVDAARVKELMVEVKAAGRQIKHTFSITNELDDRETSFNVHVGSAGDGGFTVEVLVVARDVQGVELARAHQKQAATGDACNVLSLNVGFPSDGAPPDGRLPLNPASGFCSADRWCWVSPLPQGNHLYAVWGTGPSDVYAAGDNETLLHFTGKGAHGGWTLIQTRAASEAAHPLRGIWGSGPTDVFVVGGDKACLVLHFDGKGWTRSFLTAAATASLRAVWGAGPTDVIAVGGPGCTVFHRRQDLQWQQLSISNCSESLTDIWGWSDGVLVVGTESRLAHRSKDTWLAGKTGIKSDTHLKGVWGTGPSDLYLVGRSFALYKAKTFPSVWTPENISGTADLEDVWGTGTSEVYAVGGSGGLVKSSAGAMYRHDGAKWTSLTTDDTPYLRDIWGTKASDLFVVGDGGTVLRGQGSAFSHLRKPVTTNYLRAVWAHSPSHVFVVGVWGTVARYDGAVWATEEGVSTTSDLYAVWGSGPSDVYAAGTGGSVIRYDGASWKEQLAAQWKTWQVSTPPALRGIWGSSPTSVFLVGDGGAVVFHDGKTWTLTSKPASTSPSLHAVWGTGPTDIFAAGDKGTVIHFDGTSWSAPLAIGWTALKVTTPPALRGIWGSGPSSVMFAGDNGTVLQMSKDATGSTWTLMTTGTTQRLVSVWGTSATDVFAVGAAGGIIRYARPSVTGDPAWTAMASGTTLDLWGLWGSGPTDVWTVGDHGAVLHRGGGVK